MTAAVQHVILVGYGMKSPLEDFVDLTNLSTSVPGLSNRYDIYRLVSLLRHCIIIMG